MKAIEIPQEVYKYFANDIRKALDEATTEDGSNVSISERTFYRAFATEETHIDVDLTVYASAKYIYDPGDYWTAPYSEVCDHCVDSATMKAWDCNGKELGVIFDINKLKEFI